MGWKRMILGEKMPDKNDPKYAGRYEKEVDAGRRWARLLKIDRAAGTVQRFACKHPRWFLVLVFGIVIGCLALNICRIVRVCNEPPTEQTTTVSRQQEELLRQRRNKKLVNRYNHDTERTDRQN